MYQDNPSFHWGFFLAVKYAYIMKIRCTTLFDITATGITGHFKPSRLPFEDQAGQAITDLQTWNHSRNQQRNWETVTQVLGLRTQIAWIPPIRDASGWMFEFEPDNDQVFASGDDVLALLRADCQGVPMITGLEESTDLVPWLDALGDRPNIWFGVSPLNIGH